MQQSGRCRQARLASLQTFRCFASRPYPVSRQFLKMHAVTELHPMPLRLLSDAPVLPRSPVDPDRIESDLIPMPPARTRKSGSS